MRGSACVYLSRHDDARRAGVDGYVACHESHVLKLLVHLAILLVAQCLQKARGEPVRPV